MKISPPTKPDFTPVSVMLTFETQDELDALASLLSYLPVTDALDKAANNPVISSILRGGLVSLGADRNSKFSQIRNSIEERV